MEFQEFPKIACLNRNMIVTEKIDGTNASIYIPESYDDPKWPVSSEGIPDPFLVGSRTRWITPGADNFGFAKWAFDHYEELLDLGPGHHFGEWWGSGIQRGYGFKKGERFFSLFNVSRWTPETLPVCCSAVPILHQGMFSTAAIIEAIDGLAIDGSRAAPGFMKPEGVVVYHTAGRVLFKATIEKDDEPKCARK